jgi:hypothetical protein
MTVLEGMQHESRDAAEQAAADAQIALSCPVCLELFRDPVLLPCCQQSFCRCCLRGALARSPTCPLCRAEASMKLALPNRTLDALLARGAATAPIAVATAQAATSTSCAYKDAQPLPAMTRRPRWRPEHDDNPFLPRRRRDAPARSVCEWLAKHEERIRCVAIIVAVAMLMCFLKVEEEEYAVQTGYRPRRSAPQLARLGPGVMIGVVLDGATSNLPVDDEPQRIQAGGRKRRGLVGAATTTANSYDERELQTGRPRDVLGAPHEKPAALEAQLDAAQLGYGIVGLVLVAIVAYRRAVALASVASCLDRRRLWPPMWPLWRDSGREGERAARPGAHIDIRDGQREAVEV